MEILKNNKKNIFYTVFLILFIALGYFVGIHHEAWADEAQHWLLARDCSVLELITSKLRYEGHPILWYLILKIFILLKLPYEKFFLIPLFFSSFGVYILFFKIKFPTVVKIVIPFTYYIFYQYSVIARSYCLIFPTLMILAYLWKDRFKSPFKFIIPIILLLNICLYTQILAGCILLFYFGELIINKHFQADKKTYISIFIIISFILLFNYLSLSPINNYDISKFYDISRLNLKGFLNIFGSAVYTNSEVLLTTAFSGILYVILPFLFYKNFKDSLLYFYLTFPLLVSISFFYHAPWHAGIVFLSIIFIFCVDYEKLTKNSAKILALKFILSIIFIIQINWSIQTSILDYKNTYCPAKNISLFLKENHLENSKIATIGFLSIAINPYFERNIYSNTPTSYYEYFTYQTNNKLFLRPEILILNTEEHNVIFNDNNYKKYSFPYNFIYKGKLEKSQTFNVFVKKDLIK